MLERKELAVSFEVRIYWDHITDALHQNCEKSGNDFNQIMNDFTDEVLNIEKIDSVCVFNYAEVSVVSTDTDSIKKEIKSVSDQIYDVADKYYELSLVPPEEEDE